jgi:pimeloyl-ACP methyl ester carboxylesterase
MVYLDPTDPRESKCETVMATDEEECQARWAEANAGTAGLDLPAGRRAELDAIQVWQDTPVEEREIPSDPDVPTGMLLGTLAPTGGGGPSYIDATFWAGYYERRVSRFSEWMRDLAHGTLIVATDAGHFVHRADADLAKEVVRRVLAASQRP